MLIRSALRSGDEPRLAMAIEVAKKDSVPKGVIDRALASAVDPTNAVEPILVEAAAPGGVLILVRALALNRATLMHEVRRCFNQHEVGALTAALWAFEKESAFTVPLADMDREALELLAIEHGADDVRDDAASAAGRARVASRVSCVGDDAEHRAARLAVEVAAATGAPPPSTETSYRARQLVTVADEAELEAVSALLDALNTIETVEGVFTNLDFGCADGAPSAG